MVCRLTISTLPRGDVDSRVQFVRQVIGRLVTSAGCRVGRCPYPARLAEVIVAVTGAGVEVVRTAMRASLDERDELRQRI